MNAKRFVFWISVRRLLGLTSEVDSNSLVVEGDQLFGGWEMEGSALSAGWLLL